MGLLLVLLAGQGLAHDFWIEPEAVAADPDRIELRLRVGSDLVGDSVPNIPDWYSDFSASDGNRRFPVARGIGDDPAGAIDTAAAPGYVIGYQNKPEFTELTQEKFEAYLREEGLSDILEGYDRGDPRYQRPREFYQRFAKTVVRGGGDGDSDEGKGSGYWREPLGYRLELIPLDSPFEAKRLALQLTYDGEPLPDRLVVAFTKDAPEQRQRQISDAQGRVEIELNRPGLWLVKSVYLRPYDKENADWISYWASLTFRRGGEYSGQ